MVMEYLLGMFRNQEGMGYVRFSGLHDPPKLIALSCQLTKNNE